MRSLTLAEIWELMAARGIPSVGSLDAARAIVGRANSAEPYLSNMIRALSMLTWRNTADDWRRLESALWIKKAKARGIK